MSRNDRTEERLDRLESLVEAQQETIENQQATIEDLQHAEDSESDGGRAGTTMVNRRTALKAGGLLALLGVGAGTASADAQGQVGTSGQPLRALYTQAVNGPLTGGTELTDLVGSGLTTNSGALEAIDTSAWADGDDADLLEPAGSKTGVDVATVQTGSLGGDLTDDADVSTLAGSGLEVGGGALGVQDSGIDTAELATDAVTADVLDPEAVSIDVGSADVSSIEFDGAFDVSVSGGAATVEMIGNFQVSIDDVVVGGEGEFTKITSAEYTIENKGIPDTQTVVLEVHSGRNTWDEITREVALGVDESQTFSDEIDQGRTAGTQILTIETESDSVSQETG